MKSCPDNFAKRIVSIGAPIALQGALATSVAAIDTIMVSSLGGSAIAAVGIGARWFAFVAILLFCFSSGAQIVLGQQFSSGDTSKFLRIATLSLLNQSLMGLLIGLLFVACPQFLSSVVTSSASISISSAGYVALLGPLIFITSISLSLDSILRSTGNALQSFKMYLIEFVLNVLGNYLLIFGNFGFPCLGLEGAAVASIFARSVRTLLLFFFLHKSGFLFEWGHEVSKGASQFRRKELVSLYKIFFPLLGSSISWSSAVFCYHAIIGHMGADELVVASFIIPIELIAISLASTASNGASVVLSHELGRGNFYNVEKITNSSYFLALSFGILVAFVAMIFCAFSAGVLGNLTPVQKSMVYGALPVFGLSILLKSLTGTQMHGLLKSGGDVKFCMVLDLICQWVVAIPLIFFVALILSVDFFWVYLFAQLEEVFKLLVCRIRIKNGGWARQLSS